MLSQIHTVSHDDSKTRYSYTITAEEVIDELAKK